MEKKTLLRIGDLSKKANVTPRTIRYYVQEGLLPEPEKKQKNLALYGEDCVEKIRAVKKAQTERFLPLVVIRQVLEQNNYDYSVLDLIDVPAFSNGGQKSVDDSSLPGDKEMLIPEEVICAFRKKKMIGPAAKKGGKGYAADDRQLLSLLSVFHKNGMAWDKLLASLSQIQDLVERVAELEFQALISGVMKNPTSGFHEILHLEDKIIQTFINKVRRQSLKSIVTRHTSDLDYVLLASADEGYAVQEDAIQQDLENLKQRLKSSGQDSRLLNDLALGYSCLGNLDVSMRYLRRIRKFAPDDLETQLRWIWYRRFTEQHQDQNRLKKKMETLVVDNPEYAMGRAFMAVWYSFDIQETDDPYEIFRLANLCLHEIEAADKHPPDDLHEWTLIQYIKGRLCEWLQIVPGCLESGIEAFESILQRQDELDQYYREQKPFFTKWLWPNICLFLGFFYNQGGRYDEALKLLERGSKYQMRPPYLDRLELQLKTARSGINSIKRRQSTEY